MPNMPKLHNLPSMKYDSDIQDLYASDVYIYQIFLESDERIQITVGTQNSTWIH